jgi:hypothetical protein
MNWRTFYCAILALFLSSNLAYSQNWTQVATDGAIVLQASVEDCGGIPVLLISARNTSLADVTFKYRVTSFPNPVINELKQVPVLGGGEELENDCSRSATGVSQHYVLLDALPDATLSDFKFEILL